MNSRAQTPEEQPWHHGSEVAEVGSKPWADYVRLRLVAMVDHLGEQEESFTGNLELLKSHRGWALLTNSDGISFKTIDEFCTCRRPWGLGTTWEKLRPHMVSGMAKRGKTPEEIERALQLETVPEPEKPKAGPGRGHKTEAPTPEKTEEKTEATELQSFNHETARRLRAINRAADSVKDAYREGRISQALAAKLGPKNPTPEVAAKVAEVAGEIRKLKDRKEVDQVVRERLGQRKPSIVEQAFRLVERMTPAELADFDRQIRPLLERNSK